MGRHVTIRPLIASSRSYGLLVLLFHVAILFASVHLSFSQDVVRGTLNTSDSASSNNSVLPDSFSLNVTLDSSDLHLQLDKDREFLPDVPVYVLDTDSDGKHQIHRAKLKNEEYAVYHDVTNEAAFGMVRETDGTGSSQYKLEGVVFANGKQYDLKTSPTISASRRRRRRRRRRSSTGDDITDNSVDDEEFEVRVFSDKGSFTADSIPRPPLIQIRKQMQGAAPVEVAGSVPNILVPSEIPIPHEAPKHRKKRAVTQDIYMDVVALVDYGVYARWYSRSNGTTVQQKEANTLQNIRRYYAFIFNGVSMLYKTITSLPYGIHSRLAGIVIATTGASSQFTEQYRVAASQWDEVDANLALKAMSDWAAATDLLPSYDHLMLFSGYDLTKTVSGVKSDRITGLAYTGTACDTNGKATSLVEDLGGFQCIGTAAHELGHGLSAEHDGTENSCLSEDRYIMAAGTFPVTDTNKYNPWRFSSCSLNYFNTFLSNRVNTAQGRQCLYNALTVNNTVPDVSSLLEGQLYDPDSQCRQVYGSNSRLCRGPEFGSASDICTDMFCFDPTTNATCFQLVAARGTTCGDKKWCNSGQCVYDSAAPSVDESCVFGDQPGIVFDGKSCEDFVDNFPGYCYQAVVRQRCCTSCAQHYTPLLNCEYGNKATGCNSGSCPFAAVSYKESCCGTCNYGTPITTTTTSTTTTTRTPTTTTRTTTTTTRATFTTTTTKGTTPTTATPSPPTTASTAKTTTANGQTTTTSKTTTTTATSTTKNTTSSTSTAKTPTTTTPDLCMDNATITVNQMDCATLASITPWLCYDSRVIELCCKSCRQRRTGRIGCEYGDRRDCTGVLTEPDSCSQYQPACCESCSGYVTPTGAQGTTTVSIVLLIFSIAVTVSQDLSIVSHSQLHIFC